MKTVKVRYSVTFESTIQVPDNATNKDIGEEIACIEIPENETSSYVEDTFEVETDENGEPVLY